jgi:hypothetical protein
MCPQTKKWPTKPLKNNDDWNTKRSKDHKKNEQRGKARTIDPKLLENDFMQDSVESVY